jgi:hypothetical protein
MLKLFNRYYTVQFCLNQPEACMSANTEPVARSKAPARIGWALSILTIAFMLFDAAGKLALESHVVDATTKIGYPVDAIRLLGVVALLCTILYAGVRWRAKAGLKTRCSAQFCSGSTLGSSPGVGCTCGTSDCAHCSRFVDRSANLASHPQDHTRRRDPCKSQPI